MNIFEVQILIYNSIVHDSLHVYCESFNNQVHTENRTQTIIYKRNKDNIITIRIISINFILLLLFHSVKEKIMRFHKYKRGGNTVIEFYLPTFNKRFHINTIVNNFNIYLFLKFETKM